MITKQCAGCGRYFAGQFDGDYTCAECRQHGVMRLRPLGPLDDYCCSMAPEAGAYPPRRIEAPLASRHSARGQAA